MRIITTPTLQDIIVKDDVFMDKDTAIGLNQAIDNLLRFVPSVPTVGGWMNVTTVTVKNLPEETTQNHFLEHLIALGFVGLYECVYVPCYMKTKLSRGYAFVNFVDSASAWMYKHRVDGISILPSQAYLGKQLKVSPSTVQGVDAIHAHHAASNLIRQEPTNTQRLGPLCESVPPTKLGGSLDKKQKWSSCGKRNKIGRVVSQEQPQNQQQQSSLMCCQRCGTAARPGFRFCAYCGSSFPDSTNDMSIVNDPCGTSGYQ
jgi:hypothetical protein